MDVRFGIQVEAAENRKRLEDLLFDRFRRLSKLYLRELIKTEKCEVNGRFENRGHRLRTDDFVEIELDPDRENSMVPQEMPLSIIFEDSDLIVLLKPAGVLVHPSHRDRSGTLLNGLSHYLDREGTRHIRPGLVHRLDKETSGLLVVAKNTKAHARLAKQFEKKTVEKRYAALVDGIVKDDSGEIDLPIGRYVDEKRWGVKDDGRPSLTRYNVLRRGRDMTLLQLEPVTGRTNQLRIHCAAIGHPIMGDTERGGRPAARLCLHAQHLKFRHPSSGSILEFDSPIDLFDAVTCDPSS